jgi:NAD(P)-dependent dehydrogenase (short-subunit alcohol dehydrogenase family)
MYELTGKVILVTGGAAGIGAAIVRRAAQAGARLAILDRNIETAEALASELDGAKAYSADVASFDDMQRVCAAIVSDFGRLDGAVNNAGIGGDMAPVGECTPENWAKVISINLTGVFNSVKAELAHMLAAGSGSIVNMASLAGVLSEANLPAYVASKHGVVGLTKAVAVDHGRQGIRCNAICPAYVRTPMTDPLFNDPGFVAMMNGRQPMGRTVTAEEVADIAVFLLGEGSSGMTGGVHLADGGIAIT